MLLLYDVNIPNLPQSELVSENLEYNESNRNAIESYLRSLPVSRFSDDYLVLFLEFRCKNKNNSGLDIERFENIPTYCISDESSPETFEGFIALQIDMIKKFRRLEADLIEQDSRENIEMFIATTKADRENLTLRLHTSLEHISDLKRYLDTLSQKIASTIERNLEINNGTSILSYLRNPKDRVQYYNENLVRIGEKLDSCRNDTLERQVLLDDLHNLYQKIQKDLETHSEDLPVYNDLQSLIEAVKENYEKLEVSEEFEIATEMESSYKRALEEYLILENGDFADEKMFFDAIKVYFKRTEKTVQSMESVLSRLSKSNSRRSQNTANKIHKYQKELIQTMDKVEMDNIAVLSRYSLEAHIKYLTHQNL